MSVTFVKAVRSLAKFRGAFTGPSGSGKTFSALLLAAGLAKKIAVIDTENHSASLYAGEEGLPDFDTCPIDPPYTVTKYIQAMDAAAQAGYDMTIIDSITHAWAGDGGLLSRKEALDVRGGNHFTNWAPITKEHEQFKAKLLHPDTHLIVTMRSKQDYILQENGKGQQVPKKVGMGPIQRDGMEYEFDLVLDMGMDHTASVSKTRIRHMDGQLFKPTRETGEEILKWLQSAKPAAPAPKAEANGSEAEVKVVLMPVSFEAKKTPKGKDVWIIKDVSGTAYYTFSEYAAKTIEIAFKEKSSCIIDHVRTSQGLEITDASLVEVAA